MSLIAFRRDTEDPEIVRQFAQFVGVEERLKMLCLMTLADVEAVSRETLTPWKEELLWRLYVDTYNHLTLDLRRRSDRPRAVAALGAARSAGPRICRPMRSRRFSKGCRAATCSCSRRTRSTSTCGSRATSRRTRSSAWLDRGDSGWELTVLTHDRPFLFSNISGVLSSFGMDILRGFAFTKPTGLIVDMFHFTDDERFLELNPRAEARTPEDARRTSCSDACRYRGAAARAARRGRSGAGCPGLRPVMHCDNESSRRYTIVEIVAENALGLLFRVSRAMSESGCDVDLVLIAHRRAPRDRRVPPDTGRRQADADAASGSDRQPATRSGGTLMKLIKSIVRPNKVDEVKAALEKLQISGMTVTEVRGHGKQKGHTAIYRGQEYNVSLLPKMEIEVVVPDSMADDAIKAIIEAARTGEIGDGRVFVLPVLESYKNPDGRAGRAERVLRSASIVLAAVSVRPAA